MQEKSKQSARRKYDNEFKAEVLRMVSSGRPASEIARSLGIGENLIYKWRSRVNAPVVPQQTSISDAELRSENERLKGALRRAGLSRSAYYAWQSGESYRPATNERKTEDLLVESVFLEHRRRYGVRRLQAELSNRGVRLGWCRIRRIMHQKDLKAIQPRSFIPRTTESRHPYPISPNRLLERPFPARINEVWVGDITYIPLSGSRWAYLSVWVDLYSRRIVGWKLGDHMREELVVDSFKQALGNRRPPAELIVHSDRGGQYAGKDFRRILDKATVFQSMSRADNPYDNAFMESCFSRFKAELLQGGVFDSLEDAYTEIFEYVEMYYNPVRLHSSLGNISPARYESRSP